MDIDNFSKVLNQAQDKNVNLFAQEFTSLGRDLDIPGLVARELENSRRDHKHVPHLRQLNSLNLFFGNWFAVDLVKISAPEFDDNAVSHPSNTVYFFLSPVKYKLFELRNYDNRSYRSDATIALDREGTLDAGSTFCVDAGRQILCLYPEETVVALTLSHIALMPFLWQFSTEHGKVLCHFNSSPLPTILELITKVLGIYGGSESVACLKLLLEHDSDTLKWQAASAITRIDQEEGFRAFKQLATSDSAYLSKVSLATLANFPAPG